jgi:hypothetical protein
MDGTESAEVRAVDPSNVRLMGVFGLPSRTIGQLGHVADVAGFREIIFLGRYGSPSESLSMMSKAGT